VGRALQGFSRRLRPVILACSRYIELSPVRAWTVAEPDERPW
jgi:hypothetical protein